MSLNFPASPSLDQIHQQDGASYEWTGSKWRRIDTFENAIVVEYSDIVEQTSNTALIEPDKYSYFKITVDDNTTITVPSASPYSNFVVELALGATAYTVTWSNNVEWAGGSAPSYNYGYAAKVLLDFTTYDGTNWVGSELLDYTVVPVYSFQGSVSGYTSGGGGGTNIIDKFPFASDANATDVGDLTQSRYYHTGQSSSVSGYSSGGGPFPPVDTIDKFPFAADVNATDVGNLTQARYGPSGQSSDVSGYTSGGSLPAQVNTIDKFSFSADSNATDVGDLTRANRYFAGQSSSTHGYASGGGDSPTNIIDKFSFAADANATDVGDLTQARERPSGQSSAVSGYTSSGRFPADSNVIDKFPFASDSNATDVGDLSSASIDTQGQSSTAFGYVSGAPGIQKFSFSTDGNSSFVGNLTSNRTAAAGQQV